MTLPDIERVLKQRSIWRTGYRNEELESKRRSAIIWLRNRSTRGWLADMMVKRK